MGIFRLTEQVWANTALGSQMPFEAGCPDSPVYHSGQFMASTFTVSRSIWDFTDVHVLPLKLQKRYSSFHAPHLCQSLHTGSSQSWISNSLWELKLHLVTAVLLFFVHGPSMRLKIHSTRIVPAGPHSTPTSFWIHLCWRICAVKAHRCYCAIWLTLRAIKYSQLQQDGN